MNNYGLIIQHLRLLAGLSVRTTAKKINRGVGWLSEIENGSGTARLTENEFNRIVELLGGTKHKAMFKSWVANHKNRERLDKTFDGAVLKFIRNKKGLSLKFASKIIGLSTAQISKIENGNKSVTFELRNKIMAAYGYSPSSFKNLATDPIRSKAVPYRLKIAIILNSIEETHLEAIFNFAQNFLNIDTEKESFSVEQGGSHGN